MSQFIDILTVTVPVTTGLFEAYDLVSFAGAKVITEDAPVLGMAKLPNTVIGDPAAIMAIGLGRAKAVGAVTVGAKLISAAGGGVKVAGATPANAFATALSAAADGEFVNYLIR
ncbi:MAG: hypothetical protein BGP11_08400 [Rhodobacterales bacterium 65-51]|uniref:capsid cement protein n=1 Tax=uncultured Gemmobacter sp. TaxID=1095917 RepID=UPI000967C2B4|nr:capsid cement protein [uncultured Gemmobacter sp.]OJY36355.1 MAG: hypothetical protein BGP11_08400 [Rhodobacterales bacterium 65-51]